MEAEKAEIIGTKIFSGVDGDNLARFIEKADVNKLAQLDDQLDLVAASPVTMATLSNKRIKGLRKQIQNRYRELGVVK